MAPRWLRTSVKQRPCRCVRQLYSPRCESRSCDPLGCTERPQARVQSPRGDNYSVQSQHCLKRINFRGLARAQPQPTHKPNKRRHNRSPKEASVEAQCIGRTFLRLTCPAHPKSQPPFRCCPILKARTRSKRSGNRISPARRRHSPFLTLTSQFPGYRLCALPLAHHRQASRSHPRPSRYIES